MVILHDMQFTTSTHTNHKNAKHTSSLTMNTVKLSGSIVFAVFTNRLNISAMDSTGDLWRTLVVEEEEGEELRGSRPFLLRIQLGRKVPVFARLRIPTGGGGGT